MVCKNAKYSVLALALNTTFSRFTSGCSGMERIAERFLPSFFCLHSAFTIGISAMEVCTYAAPLISRPVQDAAHNVDKIVKKVASAWAYKV